MIRAGFAIVLTASLVAATAVPAAAQSGAGGFSRAALATPIARTNLTAQATARIMAESARPLPSAGSPPPASTPFVWVPDRWISMPGAPNGAHVAGHWEQPVGGGQVFVPPLVVVAPDGAGTTIPAGLRRPANERLEP